MILSICSYVSDSRYIEIVLLIFAILDRTAWQSRETVLGLFLYHEHWNSHAACADLFFESNREASSGAVVLNGTSNSVDTVKM